MNEARLTTIEQIEQIEQFLSASGSIGNFGDSIGNCDSRDTVTHRIAPARAAILLALLLASPNPAPAQQNTTTHCGYDPQGNLTTVTDPRSLVTNHSYDALNRLTRTLQPPTGRRSVTPTTAEINRPSSPTPRTGSPPTPSISPRVSLLRVYRKQS